MELPKPSQTSKCKIFICTLRLLDYAKTQTQKSTFKTQLCSDEGFKKVKRNTIKTVFGLYDYKYVEIIIIKDTVINDNNNSSKVSS